MVPPLLTASRFLVGNTEAELKPTTFSSLLFSCDFLFVCPNTYRKLWSTRSNNILLFSHISLSTLFYILSMILTPSDQKLPLFSSCRSKPTTQHLILITIYSAPYNIDGAAMTLHRPGSCNIVLAHQPIYGFPPLLFHHTKKGSIHFA